MLQIFFVLILITVGSNAQDSYRLPNNTEPISYTAVELEFGDFDDGDFQYNGLVVVVIKVLEPTNVITLHSAVNELTVELKNNWGSLEVYNTTFTKIQNRELLVITAIDRPLQINQTYLLRITFTGTVSNGVVQGVYRGSYLDDSGIRRQELINFYQI